MQTCDVANGMACCLVGDSCCNDTSTWFEWKPGYITAVINGDGTNRLEAYVSSQSSTSPAGSSEPQSSSRPNKAAIAVGVVLSILLTLATVGLLFFWLQYSAERKRRLDSDASLRQTQQQMQRLKGRYQDAQEHEMPVEFSAHENSIREVELPGTSTEIRELL